MIEKQPKNGQFGDAVRCEISLRPQAQPHHLQDYRQTPNVCTFAKVRQQTSTQTYTERPLLYTRLSPPYRQHHRMGHSEEQQNVYQTTCYATEETH